MQIRHKWAVIAGTVLVAGGILAGAAFASENGLTAGKPRTEHLDKAVKEGKLTRAEADLLMQLGELRATYRQRFQTDAKALIDQAVKDGKITQAQADKLLAHKGRHGWKDGKPMTQEELKAKLAEAVKSGRMTQEQADRMLQRFAEHQARQNQQ
jgi:polyhydroxyalkanoate synthesis regulator phasin